MVHRNFEGHFLVEHPAGKKENDEERRDAILSFSRPSEAEKEQNCFPKMTSTVNNGGRRRRAAAAVAASMSVENGRGKFIVVEVDIAE